MLFGRRWEVVSLTLGDLGKQLTPFVAIGLPRKCDIPCFCKSDTTTMIVNIPLIFFNA